MKLPPPRILGRRLFYLTYLTSPCKAYRMSRPHQARSFANLRGFAHACPVILRRGAGENYRIPVSQRITKTAAAAEGRMTSREGAIGRTGGTTEAT